MDDAEWDDWLELSDAQQEAILDRECRAYNRWLDTLTFAEKIAHNRRRSLQTCLSWRRSMRTFPFLRERLRQSQILLVKLRAWRATGTYPGKA